jgi:hypothetical protein
VQVLFPLSGQKSTIMRRSVPVQLSFLCSWPAQGRQLGWTLLLVLQATATFAGGLEVIRPLPEAQGDTRYDYYWQLLGQALTLTEPDFGAFTLREAVRRVAALVALMALLALPQPR